MALDPLKVGEATGSERIEDHDRRARTNKRAREMRTDKACPASDEVADHA